jgi:hypothetical protein
LDDVIGILGALAVILSGLAVLVAVALRRRRAVEASGYVQTETDDEAMGRLTGALFDLAPREVHRKEDASGRSWLVFVDPGGSEDTGCAMLAYATARDDWPAVVLIRSGRRIPKIFRRLTGGFFEWTRPMAEAEARGLAGTGWFGHREPDAAVPPALTARLCAAVRGPRTRGLLGIAVIPSYLVVWSDAARLGTLLAAAPGVRAAVLDHAGQA